MHFKKGQCTTDWTSFVLECNMMSNETTKDLLGNRTYHFNDKSFINVIDNKFIKVGVK